MFATLLSLIFASSGAQTRIRGRQLDRPKGHWQLDSSYPDPSWVLQYHDYDQCYAWAKQLAKASAADPDGIASIVYLGAKGSGADRYSVETAVTHEGRAIFAILLTAPGQPRFPSHDHGTPPILYVDSAIHAREWISAATTLHMAHNLVQRYRAGDAGTRSLLKRVQLLFVPIVNPDGWQYTFTSDRMWRKNRAPNDGMPCRGVDLNRNFNFQWGVGDASPSSCSEAYRGSSPADQPETKAVQDLWSEHTPGKSAAGGGWIEGVMLLHSYGQEWLLPWAYAKSFSAAAIPAAVSALQRRVTASALAALQKVEGTTYRSGGSADIIYPIGGCALDQAYGNNGVALTFTLELRDDLFKGTYGFNLPASQISGSGVETLAAVMVVAESVAKGEGRAVAEHVGASAGSKEIPTVLPATATASSSTRPHPSLPLWVLLLVAWMV